MASFLGDRIDAVAETDERGVVREAVQNPGRPHCLDVERQRKPPPYPALVAIRECFFIKELSCDSTLNAERLDKIMNVEPFGLRAIATEVAPARRIKNQNDVGRVARSEHFDATMDM